MTNYEQKPTGWWQDSKGRAQPPGSFLDPSLRLTSGSPRGAATPRSSTRRDRIIGALRRRPV
jgi:hypothetical protein